ncbi:unnamed protein product [Aureobasidium mustum]|uniref:BTB domain-containing protein n=1 Tax=Aureobasidium mustum TaxID=2773714 RepID=A0A9N8KE54_9PEZI|nr:unnamed protein product [Aureobasidium mustum]
MSSPSSVQISPEGQSQKELRNLGTFFSDKTLSDVIVKFGDQEIFAHRIILVKSSVWFEKALLGDLKVGQHVRPAVTAMLRFFYDGTYRLDGLKGNSADQHLTMYRLADLYDASSLRKQASRHLINQFSQDRYHTNSADQYRMADQVIRSIQQIIGPSADTFADNSIQEDVFKFIIEQASSMYKNELFQELLGDGSMFSESFARRFFQKTGELITRLQRNRSDDWGATPFSPYYTPLQLGNRHMGSL